MGCETKQVMELLQDVKGIILAFNMFKITSMNMYFTQRDQTLRYKKYNAVVKTYPGWN